MYYNSIFNSLQQENDMNMKFKITTALVLMAMSTGAFAQGTECADNLGKAEKEAGMTFATCTNTGVKNDAGKYKLIYYTEKGTFFYFYGK